MALTILLANRFSPQDYGLSPEDADDEPGFSVQVSITDMPRAPTLRLPSTARTEAYTLLTPPLPDFGPEGVNADLSLWAGQQKIAFGYRNLGADDVVTIVQHKPMSFFSSVTHAEFREGCRAYCVDGSEGHPCVDCEVDDIVVRVCC